MIESSTIKNSTAASPVASTARVAGLGAIYITAAKLWFMASGYVLEVTLTNLMAAEHYGLYKVVISIISIVNAVVITGTYQTVSKYISENEQNAGAIKSKALKLQVLFGGAIALGVFLLAPVIAGRLNDPRLINYLRLAALIPLSYSFYAVFTGYFNGQRRFLTQAALDVTYSTLKLVLIIGLVWAGFGVGGAVGGFVIGAACVCLIAAAIARGGEQGGSVRARDLLTFQAYLLAFIFVLNLLQRVDLLMVKALSSADAVVASENAGYYGAALNVSNIVYQVIISITFVLFPLVSKSTFAEDTRRTKIYISTTIRYSLIVMALLATLFSANAGEVLRLIYRADYQTGAPALAIVAYGMLLFGFLQVATTIISASGRPRVSLAIAAVTLAVSAALNAALIPSRGLAGAATATTAAMLIGAISAGGYLLWKFGALVAWVSVIRVGAAAALVYAGSITVPAGSKWLILVKLAVLSLAYAAVLLLSREIGKDDVAMVKRVLKR
ncbi:MAG TPA: oligosaccharide flippase family protein [Blastocatellia bacterium]|nr:oligosaccharide flippase family protein [Blastocatellia bacterium]